MCIFCEYKDKEDKILLQNETMFAIFDNYPVNYGHVLIIPKECKPTYFDLNYKELEDANMLLKNCKSMLDVSLKPDGYNVGMNCGEYAGQSIGHAHIHLIPRYKNDVPEENLKGGIRRFKKAIRELDY